MTRPTKKIYSELQFAFDHFNKTLFNSSLPSCLITLQREKNTSGYFSPSRFINHNGEKTDEIAMNPTYFLLHKQDEILQTLVHEMVHFWQHYHGKPGRRGYHNKEWSKKMESIGLMPSDTGKVGGKKTGDKMADYIIENGKFDIACSEIVSDKFNIFWSDRFLAKEVIIEAIDNGSINEITDNINDIGLEFSEDGKIEFIEDKKQTRTKFTCKECNSSAWGKPSLNLICGNCEITMISYKES